MSRPNAQPGKTGKPVAAATRRPRRRRRRRRGAVPLSVPLVLEWADRHAAQTGRWPTTRSGDIEGSQGWNWDAVDDALMRGWPGLRGRNTLARILNTHRGKALNRTMIGPTVDQILAWADHYHDRVGEWPNPKGKRAMAGGGWSWSAIEHLLMRHGCGIDGVGTLAQLLERRRGKRNPRHLEPLTLAGIVRWADEFQARTGRWPLRYDGPVMPFSQETWDTVDTALRVGRRGVKGGSSLSLLLRARRGVVYRPPPRKPPVTVRQVLGWVDGHHRRTGEWPTRFSGRIIGVRGQKWVGIDEALKHGRRGLPRGLTLARFLALHERKPFNLRAKPLTEVQIRQWARVHHRRTGRWPNQDSGPVHGAPGEVWGNVQSALYKGSRGLPGGSSLAKLLAPMCEQRRGPSAARLAPPTRAAKPAQPARAGRRERRRANAFDWID